MRASTAILLLGLAIASCSSGHAEDQAVSSITYDSLLPSLEASSVAAADLAGSVETFCREPSPASQSAVTSAWQSAKAQWGRAWLTTWFGPADMLRTVSRVDYQPISEEGIEELLASPVILDAEYVMNQAASTERGLGAIEYLAFGDSDAGDDPRRCELLTAASEVVASETAALEQAWSSSYQDGPAFSESFAGEGMPADDALGELVSAVVETLKQQALFQVGAAAGISAAEPDPEAIPEGEAGAAADFYRAQLEAVRSLLEAGAPESLGDLISARSPEVMDRFDQHLEGALAELDQIEGSMRDIATEDPARLEPLYEHLSELLITFESDVVSLLDLTLGFSDTDGDTG